MYLNYFVHNGQRYYTGTVAVLKTGDQNPCTFICYDVVHDMYVWRVSGYRQFIRGKDHDRWIVSITGDVNKNVRMPVQKTMKDEHIPGLALGWVWYIFLMAISTLFKGNVCFWAAISVLFFAWRKKKIKEEGTYYEW